MWKWGEKTRITGRRNSAEESMVASKCGTGIREWSPPSKLKERFVKDIHLFIKYLSRIYVSGSGDTEMSKTDTWTCLLRAYSPMGDTMKLAQFPQQAGRTLYQPGKSQNPLLSEEQTWSSEGVQIMSCSYDSGSGTNLLRVHQPLTTLIHMERDKTNISYFPASLG